MILFINKVSGNEMWVAEDRIEEYKAAGHKLAAETAKPTKTKAKKTTKK